METDLDTRPKGDVKNLHRILNVEDKVKPADEREERPEDEQAGDADRAADKTPEPPKSSRGRKLLFGALGASALAIAAVGGYFYYTVEVLPYETTDDAFVDARSFSVAPKVAGFVVDAPVTDNQHVAAGAILFQIDTRDYRIALEQAEAQVQSAAASIRNVDAQILSQQSQVDSSKSAVDQAQAAQNFAKQDADRYSELAKKGFGTVQNQQSTTSTLQQREAALQQAQSNLASAEAQIKTLQAQRASAEAQFAVATAQRDQAKLNLDYTRVTAAQSGRVVRLTGSKGQYAQAAQSLAMFVPDEIWVTANFKETQVTDMRLGQKVDIRLDAYPDREITGHVDSVQPGSGTAFSLLPAENATGNYVKVTQRIPVKIVVDQWPADVSIGPGMSIVPTVTVR